MFLRQTQTRFSNGRKQHHHIRHLLYPQQVGGSTASRPATQHTAQTPEMSEMVSRTYSIRSGEIVGKRTREPARRLQSHQHTNRTDLFTALLRRLLPHSLLHPMNHETSRAHALRPLHSIS